MNLKICFCFLIVWGMDTMADIVYQSVVTEKPGTGAEGHHAELCAGTICKVASPGCAPNILDEVEVEKPEIALEHLMSARIG